MKTQVIISEITHDDLVNLFSTALYGSSYLSASYDECVDEDDDDCYEDVLAKSLLSGGKIQITDHYAEGCPYGSLPCLIDEDDDCVYDVTLDSVKTGLAKAANGTFNSQSKDFIEVERKFARKAFDSFLSEACDFDLTYADCLMQIILFDEIIYG